MKRKLFFIFSILNVMVTASLFAQTDVKKKLTFELRESVSTRDSSNVTTQRDNSDIIEHKCSNLSILDLYKLAYEDIAKDRFLFSEDLNYINPKTNEKKYDLFFIGSNEQFINQLDNSFVLKSEAVDSIIPVFVLKNITYSKNIKKLNNVGKSTEFTKTVSSHSMRIKGQMNAKEIAAFLEEDLGAFVNLDSSINEKRFYEVDISMEGDYKPDDRIAFFKKAGIHLEKGVEKVRYVHIKKKAVSRKSAF
jgi:hypothetical protein